MIGAGLAVLASYLGLAIVHLRTLYDVNQTSGAWLSFAFALRHGAFYPPPDDHGFYTGTRYMPLFPALHAAFALATGEYLASGKLVTLVSTIAIVAALFLILRPRLRNTPLAIAMAAVPLATYIGHKGSLTIRSDVLPLALSLFALHLYERGRHLSSAILAGLAPLAKFTAFFALAAVAIDLFFRAKDRKRALLYGALGFTTFIAGVLVIEAISNGGLSRSFAAAALAGQNGQALGRALQTYAWYVLSDRTLILLIPFALIALALTRPDVYTAYLLLVAVISAGFFFDVGAEYNHLIDLVAATVILTARLFESETDRERPLRYAALTALSIACIAGLGAHHLPAWRAPERGLVVDRWLASDLDLCGKKFLTQDPTVAVLLGVRPVVSDDFQYRVLVAKGVVPADDLAGRIRSREFDRIVLLNPPEANDPEDPEWTVREFGPRPARAIRDRYTLEKRVGKYYVYRPR